MNIENKWFKKESNCQEVDNKVASNSLGTDSFWVLFLFVGFASTLALIIFVTSFIYRHRHVLMHSDTADPRNSTWGKIRTMLDIFNEKDLDCHTFKTKQPQETSSNSGSCPPSPVPQDSDSVFDIEQPQDESPGEVPAVTTVDVVTIQEMHSDTP